MNGQRVQALLGRAFPATLIGITTRDCGTVSPHQPRLRDASAVVSPQRNSLMSGDVECRGMVHLLSKTAECSLKSGPRKKLLIDY